MSFFSYILNLVFLLLLQILGVLFLYFGFRVLFKPELGWKIFYIFVSILGAIVIGSFGVSSLLQYLFRDYGVIGHFFIIRDTNAFVVLLMELVLFSTFFVTFPTIVYLLYTYIVASLTKTEKTQLDVLLLVCCYYYYLVFFIVNNDLSLSSWDVMLSSEAFSTYLQLQPDLDFLFLSFWGEWVDLWLLVCFEIGLFVIFYLGYLSWFWWQSRVHFCLLFCHLLFTFYFFCGEGYLFDFVLLLVSFIFFELLYFQLRFFFILKLRKRV